MHHINDYDVLIFDCDGVIFDSNQFKLDAMADAVSTQAYGDKNIIAECIKYFKNNFGKSRYHHIRHFVDIILNVSDKDLAYEKILEKYAQNCSEVYLLATETYGLRDLLQHSNAVKYVASGSDQNELRKVFSDRDLANYFIEIYGSPDKKIDIVEKIVSEYSSKNILMIGDAYSDYEASAVNAIDFLFFEKYSLVKKEMILLSKKKNFKVCVALEDLIDE